MSVRIAAAVVCAAHVFSASQASAQPSPSASSAPPAPPAPPSPPSPPSPPAPQLTPPKLLTTIDVPYPEGASGDRDVTLLVTVATDGSVEQAVAERDEQPFAAAAEDAVRAARFEPALRGGAPVRARIRFLVSFRAPAPTPPPRKVLVDPPAATGPAAGSTSRDAAGPSRAASAPQVEEVRVRGARGEPSRTASLTRAEVRQIPGTFGDPFRAIEIMPGVTPIVSGLPFFFIRGAPPGNVGYYLDGVRVPYLFHVGAGPSVVHPGLMDRVDLYPGGYPARYGRVTGGIVAGETLGDSPQLRGEYNLRAFDVGALVETPFAGGKGSALVGGRYSYTGLILSLVSPETVLDYWDYQARVGYKLTPKDKISVFAFGAYDYLAQKTPTETLTLFGTQFHRIDTRYEHELPHRGLLRTAVTLGVDRTMLQNDRFLRDRLLGARTEITMPLADREGAPIVRAGADLQFDRYDIELGPNDLNPATSNIASAFPTRSDLFLGVRADMLVPIGRRLELTPGARVDLFSSDGVSALAADGRLAMRAQVADRVALLSSIGLAHQPPSFVIPVPGFQPGGLRGGLQRALQESFGAEFELGAGTSLTTTVFHNAFFNMSDALSVTEPQINGCPPGAFPRDTLAGDPGRQPVGNAPRCTPRFAPDTVGPDRSGGGGQASQTTNDERNARVFETRARGSAYGLEIFLKRRITNRIGGFLSYTLSRSTRTANGATFIASFDRTHVLGAALAVDLGRNWRAGARGTLYSGLPKAPNPAEPGDTRLDAFYRIDLRLEKKWQLSKRFWIAAVAEWLNVTFNTESVGTNCTLNGCQEQKVGPVTIPSLGVEGGF